MYVCIYVFNAKVSLKYYFDSPNWLITTCFHFFLFCHYHVCYMLYMSVFKTMCSIHVWNKIYSVLFCYKLYVWCLSDHLKHYVKLITNTAHGKWITSIYNVQENNKYSVKRIVHRKHFFNSLFHTHCVIRQHLEIWFSIFFSEQP